MHLRIQDLAAPIQATHNADKEGQQQAEAKIASSLAILDEPPSSISLSSSDDEDSSTTALRCTSVTFCEDTTIYYLTENLTIEEYPELWYTRQECKTFRYEARRRAVLLRQLDDEAAAAAAQEEDDDESSTDNDGSWSQQLLADYEACSRASSTERLPPAQLVLDATHFSTGTKVGLEILACKEIARDLEARRRHLLEQVYDLQYGDATLRPAERERLLAKTSRICSRSARLFAQHVGQTAAMAVDA